MKRISILIIFLVIFTPFFAFSIDGVEIIKRLEYNQTFKTIEANGKMVISDRFGERIKTFIVYGRGKEETLIEFTSIDEKGQKILRTRDEIYLYYPDAEQIIRIQGAALRESVAGSDLSYEDLTGGKDFMKKYSISFKGVESIDSRACYVLRLIAKKRDVSYPRELLWIEKGTFSLRKAQYFSLSGKLIKEVQVKKIEKIKDHYIPTQYIFHDVLKRDSKTEFFINNIKINIPLSDDIFSLEELSW